MRHIKGDTAPCIGILLFLHSNTPGVGSLIKENVRMRRQVRDSRERLTPTTSELLTWLRFRDKINDYHAKRGYERLQNTSRHIHYIIVPLHISSFTLASNLLAIRLQMEPCVVLFSAQRRVCHDLKLGGCSVPRLKLVYFTKRVYFTKFSP